MRFADSGLDAGGELVLDARPATDPHHRKGSSTDMAKTKAKRVTCKDCFFGANGLCALNLEQPCPTFRAAENGLRPQRQLAFVFRTERTHAAYAFPQVQ